MPILNILYIAVEGRAVKGNGMRGVDGLYLRVASDFILSDIRWLHLSDGAQCLWLTLSAIALKERREFLPAGYEDALELAYRRRREPEEIERALAELLDGPNPILQTLPDGRLRVRGVRSKHGDAFKWADETVEAEIWNSVETNDKLDPAEFAAVKPTKKGKKPHPAPARRRPDEDPGSSGRGGNENPTTMQRGGNEEGTRRERGGKVVGTTMQSSSHRESPQGQGQRQGKRQRERQPSDAPPNRRSGASEGKQVAEKRASGPSGAGPSPPPLVPSGDDGPPGGTEHDTAKATADARRYTPMTEHGGEASKVPKKHTLVDVAMAAFTRETARWSGDPEPASLTSKVRERLRMLAKQGWDTAIEALGHIHDVTAGLKRKKKQVTKPWRTLEKRLGGAKGIMKPASPDGRKWAKMILGGGKPRRSKAEPQMLGEAAASALARMGIEPPGTSNGI